VPVLAAVSLLPSASALIALDLLVWITTLQPASGFPSPAHLSSAFQSDQAVQKI
jgi:hypothetical protein